MSSTKTTKKPVAKKTAAKKATVPAKAKMLTVTQATKADAAAKKALELATAQLKQANAGVETAKNNLSQEKGIAQKLSSDFGESNDSNDKAIINAATRKVNAKKRALKDAEKKKKAAEKTFAKAEQKAGYAKADLTAAKKLAPKKNPLRSQPLPSPKQSRSQIPSKKPRPTPRRSRNPFPAPPSANPTMVGKFG